MTQMNWYGPAWGMADAARIRRNWGWFLTLGVLLVILGIVCLGASGITTLVSIVLFGSLLLGGGVVELVRAFSAIRTRGFLLHLLTGVLYGIVGLMMLLYPGAGALTLTLLLAALLTAVGFFRIVASSVLRYRHWGWTLASGILSLVLGVLIWRQWPLSGMWVIGAFIGIEMLFYGWTTVLLSLATRTMPIAAAPGEERRAAA